MEGAAPHNQIDAEVAAGMGHPDNGPRLQVEDSSMALWTIPWILFCECFKTSNSESIHTILVLSPQFCSVCFLYLFMEGLCVQFVWEWKFPPGLLLRALLSDQQLAQMHKVFAQSFWYANGGKVQHIFLNQHYCILTQSYGSRIVRYLQLSLRSKACMRLHAECTMCITTYFPRYCMRAFEVGSCMWLYSSAKKNMSAICSTWPWLYRETPITS